MYDDLLYRNTGFDKSLTEDFLETQSDAEPPNSIISPDITIPENTGIGFNIGGGSNFIAEF